MNCQEGVFYQYVLLLTPFAFYRNTHVFLSSLILLKAFTKRSQRSLFPLLLYHSKKLSCEASPITHTD